MLNYFYGSYVITIIGLFGAWFWGEHVHPGTGWMCVFIAFILSILEVSLSFDNAVVNAMKLEHMPPVWQKRFLTWGIAIAVFGMRLLFPLLVVAVFAQVNIINVAQMALFDVNKYAEYLHETHAPIVAFGGTFLMMLALSYFFDSKKDVHWIRPLEARLVKLDGIFGIETAITAVLLLAVWHFSHKPILAAGISGVVIYLAIDGVSKYLEKSEQKRLAQCGSAVKQCGPVAFIYLELIDASFSLDGVLGAFALSHDIIIITIGLSVGAMFVRSLTIMLVDKKTLHQFPYLEHGAHWAIGVLALLMLVSTFHDVPEAVTGLAGLILIITALISSVLHNKKMERLLANE